MTAGPRFPDLGPPRRHGQRPGAQVCGHGTLPPTSHSTEICPELQASRLRTSLGTQGREVAEKPARSTTGKRRGRPAPGAGVVSRATSRWRREVLKAHEGVAAECQH